MRKKIFALVVSAGLLAAPGVFAATAGTGTSTAVPVQTQQAPENYGMPMMYRGGTQFYGEAGLNDQYGYGMMARGYGVHFGLLAVAHAVTMLLVWILLVLLICAVAMHLRRMRRHQQWRMENKAEGKPETKI